MEYCPYSLKELRKEREIFSESQVKTLMRDILLGIQCLHKQNMIHFDIKPGILIYLKGNCNILNREYIKIKNRKI